MCVLLSVALAEIFVRIDLAVLLYAQSENLPWLFTMGVDGSRGLLSGIGAATFGAAATAFSITVSVIATASTSYGPRLVGNFMASRKNQWILGVLVSTFVYTTLVVRYLRSDSGDGNTFVPALSVYFAILLALADVFLLIAFIQETAESIQVEKLAAGASKRFTFAVDEYVAQGDGDGSSDAAQIRRDLISETEIPKPPTGGNVVTAPTAGYVRDVDRDALLAAAFEDRGVVVTLVRVGDHVVPGAPIARINPGTDPEAFSVAVRKAISVGEQHEFSDVVYAQQQVIELAVRALSPGTNDPYTAITAIDELSVGMSKAVSRPMQPQVLAGADEIPRVFLRHVTLRELIDLAFEQISDAASGEFQVWQALVRLAATIERANIHPELRGYAWARVERIRGKLEKNNPGALGLLDGEIERVIDAELGGQAPMPA